MHCPTSAMTASSRSTPPIVWPETSRASASCWRTVPTRQGTHWPHDSLRKKAAIRMQQPRQVDGLVEDEDDARAEGRLRLARGLERQRQVELVRAQEAARGAAR